MIHTQLILNLPLCQPIYIILYCALGRFCLQTETQMFNTNYNFNRGGKLVYVQCKVSKESQQERLNSATQMVKFYTLPVSSLVTEDWETQGNTEVKDPLQVLGEKWSGFLGVKQLLPQQIGRNGMRWQMEEYANSCSYPLLDPQITSWKSWVRRCFWVTSKQCLTNVFQLMTCASSSAWNGYPLCINGSISWVQYGNAHPAAIGCSLACQPIGLKLYHLDCEGF